MDTSADGFDLTASAGVSAPLTSLTEGGMFFLPPTAAKVAKGKGRGNGRFVLADLV
jgi:hypothetical protein